MSVKHDVLGKNYRARKTEPGEDFFPTYHALTRALLERVKFPKDTIFLEPCAGAGDISKVIREYYPLDYILQYDIAPRVPGIEKADFLKKTNPIECDVVITNPPFTMFLEFFKQCCRCARKEVIMLCPLDYLHGVERYKEIFQFGCRGFFLQWVYVFVRRSLFGPQYRPDGPMPTGATTFCWMRFTGKTSVIPGIDWLDINEGMGQPWLVDQLRMDGVK